MTGNEPLEDWEEEILAEGWDEPGEVVHPRGGPRTAIQSIRFQRDELNQIRDAAANAGLTTSTFIRQVVAREIARQNANDGDAVGIGEHAAEELERLAAVVRQLSQRAAATPNTPAL